MLKMTIQSNEIELRPASIDEIISLREEVIIRGTNRDSPYFDGDRDETTRHFGAFIGTKPIGCLSFMRKEWEGTPAWQLRGMATAPDYRGSGVGKILLQLAEEAVMEESGIRLLWCNARAAAAGFYEKQGWKIVSDEFLIPGVGPHYKMLKDLRSMFFD
ncbi:MAG: GNAT family N-acetyltransferase [Candidatus Omnitrophota bacterium]